jgi:GNAT superfamily N-acetyltransferase
MGLSMSTQDEQVRAACEQALTADPVGNTLFSSVLGWVEPGRGWCAVAPDGAVAARSRPSTPLALSDGWSAIDGLIPAVVALGSIAALNGPERSVEALAAGLGREAAARTRERLFRCDVLDTPAGVAGSARPSGVDDRELLIDWFTRFMDEAMGGSRADREIADLVDQALAVQRVWLWLDAGGAPVSLARRQSPAFGVARIGPVYTPPAVRGHGYGSAVTAAATREVLDSRAVPVLFTDLANPTSNAIYQRLGYRPVSDHLLIRYPD